MFRTKAAIFFGLLTTSCHSFSEEFVNLTAGFRMEKPAEWTYVTASANTESLRALKLNDSSIHEAMLKYTTSPLIAIMKYSGSDDDISPSFKVQLKPYGHQKGKTPIEISNLALPQLKTIFKDFVVVQEPIETLVSGISSSYTRANYTMETPAGGSFQITSEFWIVPHGDYFFMIGAGTRQDERTGSREEIKKILNTVKIER